MRRKRNDNEAESNWDLPATGPIVDGANDEGTTLLVPSDNLIRKLIHLQFTSLFHVLDDALLTRLFHGSTYRHIRNKDTQRSSPIIYRS